MFLRTCWLRANMSPLCIFTSALVRPPILQKLPENCIVEVLFGITRCILTVFHFNSRNFRCNVAILQLPISVDIIKHPREKNGKSTALHCLLIAPTSTRLFDAPNVCDYRSAEDRQNTVLSYSYYLLLTGECLSCVWRLKTFIS